MQHQKAIVIGSGVAGLAAAIRLAVQGIAVDVYEKNSGPGGKITAFKKNDFCFDAGPSLFIQPKNIEEIFELAGEPIEQYFTYKQVDIACKYFYENGKVVNAFTDAEKFAEELKLQLNEQPVSVTKYLQHSQKLYEKIGSIFLNHSLQKRKTWLTGSIWKALAAVKYAHLFKSLNELNKQQFKSAEAVQLFNRFATYNGSSPFKAPGMLSMIAHLEHCQGTFYPDGGMVSITNALYQLAIKKGVKFYFNEAVQRIIHHNGKVKGVVVNNENIYCNLLLSNSDIYFSYKKLLNDTINAGKILRHERSSSAVIFYWGINQQFPQLQLHNILFSKNYQEEFNHIFTLKKTYHDPSIYINISSKEENAMAPAGKENWFVMVNVPANTGQDWDLLKENIRQNVIEKINRMLNINLEELIESEQVLDPVLMEEQTGSFMGSLYGSSSNSKLAAFLRHSNFTDSIKGLYFCGGSVHPGGGIPLCLHSAKIVSNLITADLKKQSH